MTIYLVLDSSWSNIPEVTSWMDVTIMAFDSVEAAITQVVSMSEGRAAAHNRKCKEHNQPYDKAVALGLTGDELRAVGLYRWDEKHGLFFADDWDIVAVNPNGKDVTLVVPGRDIPPQDEWPWTTPFLWKREK